MLASSSQPLNGSMTENITYDDLYTRYENSKHLLKEIRASFTGGFQEVQTVIQRHQTQENGAFIQQLSTTLTTIKTSLGQLFAQSIDPGLFEPTKLEQQLVSFQAEKKQGLELVSNLQSTIASLQEEKRNWQIREEKGKKLIEQYQLQLDSKNGTYVTPSSSTDTSSTVYDENTNADALKKQVAILMTDNQRLQEELSTYKQRLSEKGGNVKQLYRDGSVTEWDPKDLAAMKEEMKKAMMDQHQETLERQFEKQFSLRMPSSENEAAAAAAVEEIKENTAAKVTPTPMNTSVPSDNDTIRPPTYDRAFRDGTKTDWDDMELNKLKENMAQEMRQMATQEKQRAIQAMSERNDAIRDIADGSSANLIEPRGYGDVSIDEQQVEQEKQAEKEEMRAQMQAMVLSEKQRKIQEMANRDAVLRDETTNINVKREIEEAEQDKVDILAEMQRIKREKLEEQFNKNFELVTEGTEDVVATKILIEDADDAKAMEQQFVAMKKQEIYHGTNTFLSTAEPQIKPAHKNNFISLMHNIGILNPNQLQILWDNIEHTVNDDKREAIPLRQHSMTASQAMSDASGLDTPAFKQEMDTQAEEELQRQLEDTQLMLSEQTCLVNQLQDEIQSMREQQQLEEDDSTILLEDTETETPGGPQQIHVNNNDTQMNELMQQNERLKAQNDEIKKRVNEMESNISGLNQEIQRISKSKIEVLINTSKEIDALRQLLADYVTLANQQRNKRK